MIENIDTNTVNSFKILKITYASELFWIDIFQMFNWFFLERPKKPYHNSNGNYM